MADHIHRNSLKPGYKLHWYRIESVLGQGGFGLTYLVFDFNLDQQAAIKEYLPIELAVRERDFSVHPVSEQAGEKYQWGLDRFIAEARTLARFKHPNIVRVMNVFEANNTAYMVMEYEHGESLQEILTRRNILEEEELMNLLLPVLGGLQKVHDTGFIHRDIKPGNIFLRKDGSPVLLDFGSARQALGVATQTLTSLVSPGYAPFEQYHSKSNQQGPWTDIYGLGATLYRAIAGMAPMDSLDRSGAILKTGKDVLVPATEVGRGRYSERFLRAIDHALQFKEEDRPQSVDKWRREFSIAVSSVTFSHSLPSEAPTAIPTDLPPAGTNARTTLPRMRRITGALLAMAVLAGSGIGYSWWRGEQARQQRELAEKKVAMAEISLAEGDLAGARTYLLEGAAADPQAPSLNAALGKMAEAAKAREHQISALLKEAETAAQMPDGQAAAANLEAALKLGAEAGVVSGLRNRMGAAIEKSAAEAFAASREALAAKDTAKARKLLARVGELKRQAGFLATK